MTLQVLVSKTIDMLTFFFEVLFHNKIRCIYQKLTFEIIMSYCSAKFPFGEISDGKNPVRRKFHSAKIPFGENIFDENSVGEYSFGENSGHGKTDWCNKICTPWSCLHIFLAWTVIAIFSSEFRGKIIKVINKF